MSETKRIVVRDVMGFDWIPSPDGNPHDYATKLTDRWPDAAPYRVVEITTTITERVIAPNPGAPE